MTTVLILKDLQFEGIIRELGNYGLNVKEGRIKKRLTYFFLVI